MIAGLWPGIWDLRLMAFYLLKCFAAGMVTRQVFMLNFTSWGSIMPTPLAKAYSKKEVCIELWIRF